ncbi:hypothetical protein FOBRF1_002377 [Fusarium oxysporum]
MILAPGGLHPSEALFGPLLREPVAVDERFTMLNDFVSQASDKVQTHTGIKDGLFETQDRDFPHIFCTTTQEELEISSESKEQQGYGFFRFC